MYTTEKENKQLRRKVHNSEGKYTTEKESTQLRRKVHNSEGKYTAQKESTQLRRKVHNPILRKSANLPIKLVITMHGADLYCT